MCTLQEWGALQAFDKLGIHTRFGMMNTGYLILQRLIYISRLFSQLALEKHFLGFGAALLAASRHRSLPGRSRCSAICQSA